MSIRATAEGLLDMKDQRVRVTNRVERGGTGDKIMAADMKAAAESSEKLYEKMLLGVYQRGVPDRIREFAAGIPGQASGPSFPWNIAMIGNPRIATPYHKEGNSLIAGEPYQRSVSQLWSYAGCGDPERRPKKGMVKAELLAMGKRTTLRPRLHTWSSWLVKSGHLKSVSESKYYNLLLETKDSSSG